ncbi:acyl-CoA thioesterase domain-containing protein [Streptomyces sp. NPDC006482]|uniref:acyl-CoA thioesterase domain-containing protein n=1 Tax=Streptomyces sp. NPDC006482 TaxID=3154306 RepID=UPI0033BA873A
MTTDSAKAAGEAGLRTRDAPDAQRGDGAAAGAFFHRFGDELHPQPAARGYWSASRIHGRLFGGLAARTVEREHLEGGLVPARLTLDLFRSAPMAPVTVSSERVRDGRRIRVVDVGIRTGGELVARAQVVLLQAGGRAVGEVWSPPAWVPPPVDTLGPPHRTSRPGEFVPPFDLWRVDPDERSSPGSGAVRRRAVLRETRQLVLGETLGPLVRLGLAADYASPLANSGTSGLEFINADFTLRLCRMPADEAIGMESSGHMASDGIAVGQATLFDGLGAFGTCGVSALANVRRQGGAPGDPVAPSIGP